MVDRKRKFVSKLRLRIMFTVIALAFCGLILRLAVLQVREGPSFRNVASSTTTESIPISAPRGFIYDRNGDLLASDQFTYTVIYTELKWSSEKIKNQLAEKLAPVLNMTVSQIVEKMNSNINSAVVHRLKLDATDKMVSFVQENQSELPGISIVREPQREYKYGDIAAHMIGYLGAISPSEWTKYKADTTNPYQPDTQVGISGIEKEYESYLHGHDGAMKVVLNNAGQPIKNLGMSVTPTAGDSLVLNLDMRVQTTMQNALADQIHYLQTHGHPGVETGSAVAMDPQTGAVLGMASYPYYDPQWFVGGISDANYKKFSPAQMNLAIQDPVYIGSTEKPLTLMAALQDHVITPSTTIDDHGGLYIGNRFFHDWVPSGHGIVDAVKAIAVSCDTFLYQVSLWMGHWTANVNVSHWFNTDRLHYFQRLAFYQKQFGLGVKTDVDLPYEEVGGLQGYGPNGTLGDLPYAAIGQDEQFTMMQLAQYVSTIANGGKRMEPQVVREIKDPSGTVIKKFTPKVLNTVTVSQANLDVIKKGMYEVCNYIPGASEQGTAYSVFIGTPYKAAGKTGTAQTGLDGFDTTSFIGWAPFNTPKIAIAIVIPGGVEGYESAGPVARKVFDAYLLPQASSTGGKN